MTAPGEAQQRAERILNELQSQPSEDGNEWKWTDEFLAEVARDVLDLDAALEGEIAHRQVMEALADETLSLLRELREYTAELEKASAAWFATRVYAKRPDAGDLGARLDEALAGVPVAEEETK